MHLDLEEAFTKVPKKNSSTVKEKEVTLFDEDDTPRKHSGRRIRYASPPPKPYPGSVIKPDYHETLDARECKLAACKTHGKTPIPPAVWDKLRNTPEDSEDETDNQNKDYMLWVADAIKSILESIDVDSIYTLDMVIPTEYFEVTLKLRSDPEEPEPEKRFKMVLKATAKEPETESETEEDTDSSSEEEDPEHEDDIFGTENCRI
jgi:hypothetical protein